MIHEGREGRRSWWQRKLERARAYLRRDLWSIDLGGQPTLRAFLYKSCRVLYLAGRGVIDDRCLFRAAGLAYITVLSIVPLLAFAFSVAKGLGAYEKLVTGTIEPFLERTFGPSAAEVGASANSVRTAIDEVLRFVQNTNVGSLGVFGLVLVLYTVVKLLSAIERSFNDIWGVHKARRITRRVADYLSIVIIVPLFLVTATGITTAIQSDALLDLGRGLNLGPLIEYLFKFSSLIGMWFGFALVYMFMPNTRTRFSSALLGGVVGGTMWHVAQILHVRFQIGMANYNAIYSGFAAFPMFLIWIYVSWVTVLFGAEFAFAHQNEPTYRQIARARDHDHVFMEVLAARAMVRVAAVFIRGAEPYDLGRLAADLDVPERSLKETLSKLEARRIVAPVDDGFEVGILPARDLERISIKLILDALKGPTDEADFPPTASIDREIDQALADFERVSESAPENRNVRELAERFLASGEGPG